MTMGVRVSGWRRLFTLLVFVVVVAGLLWRAVYLQHYRQNTLQREAANRQLRTVEIPAHRGMITDRNGYPLAVSTPVYAAWVDPVKFDFSGDAIRRLAAALEFDAADLHAKLERRKHKRFVYVKRHLKPGVAWRVRKLELDGVALRREHRRFYPMSEAAAHLIGATNLDDTGIEGVEKQFDEIFRGVPGKKRVLRDRYGRTVEQVALVSPPKPGKRLTLTIDRNIQYRTYRALKTAVKKHGARSGSAVLMDAHSGEILALVNQPSFNPNTRRFVPEHRRNRALTDEFEPGSTIKPFIAALLLEKERASFNERINTAPGYYKVSGEMIADFKNYGELTLPEVIIKSSNVGISKAAAMASAEELWRMLRELGFGRTPGTGFPGETGGRLPHYVDWRGFDQAAISYGYGASVSLLQLVHAYSVFANDGWRPPLSLVQGTPASEKVRVFTPETARAVRGVLERVVAEGTGKKAAIEGFTIAGKTGTVHKSRQGEYVEEEYLSLFVGFAPGKGTDHPSGRPRLVAAVMLDTPTGNDYFGGDVAAPVFAEIMRDALRRLGVPGNRRSPSPVRASQQIAEHR